MRTFKVAILFSGNGSNMQNLIERLHNHSFSVTLDSATLDSDKAASKVPNSQKVVPQKPDSERSESRSQPASCRIEIALTLCNNPAAYGITRARSLNIPCEVIDHRDFSSREDFDNAMLEVLRSHGIELCLLAGFMRILSAPFTRSIPLVNIHPSYLPAHKGAHAIRDSFEAGCDGGVSVHWVNEELDAGAIILQERLSPLPSDTLESFEAKIHALEYELYPKAVLRALSTLLDSQNSESSTSESTQSTMPSGAQP